MFSFDKGKIIAKITGGESHGERLYVNEIDNKMNIRKKIDYIKLNNDEKFEILPDNKFAQVLYVSGPRGSGKTTFCLQFIKNYLKMNRGKKFYLFSRTDCENDEAYEKMGLEPWQVIINDEIYENPINIERDLNIKEGCIIFFDDCHTINNDKIRKEIEKLIKDIIEVGRKMKIVIVITNHLLIPDERKLARCIMNEFTILCVFPRGGSLQQIEYCITKYLGYKKNQVEEFLKTNSRWLCFYKDYPKVVINESEAIIPK